MAVARLFVVNVAIVSVAVLERDVAVGVRVGGAESVSAPMVASPNVNPRARVKRGRGYEVPRVGQVWRAKRGAARQMTDQPGAFLGTGFLMIRLHQSAHSHAPGVFPDNSALPISAQSRDKNKSRDCALIGLFMYSQRMYSFGQSAHSHATKLAFIIDL